MARDDHRVMEDDLTAIGGFEGVLGRHVERQIGGLFHDATDDPVHPERVGFWLRAGPGRGLSPAARNDQEQFQMLLTMLTLRQVDGDDVHGPAPRGGTPPPIGAGGRRSRN